MMRPWMEKLCSVLLVIFCALVILFSALYTRQEDVRNLAAQNAAASRDETLAEAAARYAVPVAGDITQLYQGAYKTSSGLWAFDPFVRFSVRKGEKVFAPAGGSILSCSETEIRIAGEDDQLFRLKGAFSPLVSIGDRITAGQDIARITQAGEVCLSLSVSGHYIDPLQLFTP